MKALSIVLAVVAACLLALIAVFWFGGALEAEIAIAPAIAGEEALTAVEDAQNGLAVDICAPIDETRDCVLTDITVTFANSGLFDAEWLTCSLVPGAGDVFNGYLAAALASGKSLREAAAFANVASGIAVTRKGAVTSVPLYKEVMNLYGSQSERT